MRRLPAASDARAGRSGLHGVAENLALQRIGRAVGVPLGTTRMDRRSPALTATEVTGSVQLLVRAPEMVQVGLPPSTPLIRMLKV